MGGSGRKNKSSLVSPPLSFSTDQQEDGNVLGSGEAYGGEFMPQEPTAHCPTTPRNEGDNLPIISEESRLRIAEIEIELSRIRSIAKLQKQELQKQELQQSASIVAAVNLDEELGWEEGDSFKSIQDSSILAKVRKAKISVPIIDDEQVHSHEVVHSDEDKAIEEGSKDEVSSDNDGYLERILSPFNAAVLNRVGIQNSALLFEILDAGNALLPIISAQYQGKEMQIPVGGSCSPMDTAILERIGFHNSVFFYEVKNAIAELQDFISHDTPDQSSSDDEDNESSSDEEVEVDTRNIPLIKGGATHGYDCLTKEDKSKAPFAGSKCVSEPVAFDKGEQGCKASGFNLGKMRFDGSKEFVRLSVPHATSPLALAGLEHHVLAASLTKTKTNSVVAGLKHDAFPHFVETCDGTNGLLASEAHTPTCVSNGYSIKSPPNQNVGDSHVGCNASQDVTSFEHLPFAEINDTSPTSMTVQATKPKGVDQPNVWLPKKHVPNPKVDVDVDVGDFSISLVAAGGTNCSHTDSFVTSSGADLTVLPGHATNVDFTKDTNERVADFLVGQAPPNPTTFSEVGPLVPLESNVARHGQNFKECDVGLPFSFKMEKHGGGPHELRDSLGSPLQDNAAHCCLYGPQEIISISNAFGGSASISPPKDIQPFILEHGSPTTTTSGSQGGHHVLGGPIKKSEDLCEFKVGSFLFGNISTCAILKSDDGTFSCGVQGIKQVFDAPASTLIDKSHFAAGIEIESNTAAGGSFSTTRADFECENGKPQVDEVAPPLHVGANGCVGAGPIISIGVLPCFSKVVDPIVGSPSLDQNGQVLDEFCGGLEHKGPQFGEEINPAILRGSSSQVVSSIGPSKKSFVELFHPSTGQVTDPGHHSIDNGPLGLGIKDPRTDFTLHHVHHGPRENNTKLCIPKEIAIKRGKELVSSLVGHFIGRKLPFSLVASAAVRFWGKLGLVETLATDSGTYFFKFSNAEARDSVLEGGPWYIAGRPIILRQWKPNLRLDSQGVKSIPIWVQLYNIPLEYWTPEGISYIASFLGKPIHVDRVTASGKRITFARVCIEVFAEDELLSEFDIEAEGEDDEDPLVTKIRVEYQWTPSRCAKCKVFGHNCSNVKHDFKPPTTTLVGGGVWKASQIKDKGKGKIEENVVVSSRSMGSSSAFVGVHQLVEDSIVSSFDPSLSSPMLSTTPRGKNDVSPVIPMQNSFQALPSMEEVGAAMDQVEVVQDTSAEIECVDNAVEFNEELEGGYSIAGSPSSSRQKKKTAQKKKSGNRPKGRHKS